MRNKAFALLVRVVACSLTLLAPACEPSMAPEALAQRVASSQPTWQNYDEDIKDQVGAAPVAEWQGTPISAERAEGGLRVRFRIEGAWADRQVAMPVLMRDPRGDTLRCATAETQSGEATYLFATLPGPLPWIELRYPRGLRRIALSEAGQWHAEENP